MIQLENVNFKYKKKQLFKEFSLDIEKGKTHIMKTYSKIFLFLAFVFLSSFPVSSQVINCPEVLGSNTRMVEINTVELSDTATVLLMDAYGHLGQPTGVTSGTYLLGNSTGRKYKLIRSSGLELDKEVNLPESGNISFKLQFEPLDKQDKNIDFVEYPGENMFLIQGIELTGKENSGKIKTVLRGAVVDRPYSSRLMLAPKNSDTRVYPWISIPVRDGKFEYTLFSDVEEVYELTFYDEEIKGSWYPFCFFAEEGDLEITLYPMEEANIKNTIITTAPLNNSLRAYESNLQTTFDYTPLMEESEKLQKDGDYFSEDAKSLFARFNEASETQNHAKFDELYKEQAELEKNNKMLSLKGQELNNKFQNLANEQEAWELNYIKENISLLGYYRLINLFYSAQYSRPKKDTAPYILVFNEYYKNKFPSHPYTEKIKVLASGNEIKVGGHYIDFTAPDMEGNEISLSSQIQGKVALIDLWASWCGPCRRKSISMIPVYESFKDKGFTIVGVARENDPKNMQRAVERDGYTWINLLELKDRNKIWETYGVGNGGGATFLVDESGKILAINPDAGEVEKILTEKLF